MAVLTLLIAGCSKPEEVISSRLAQANKNLESGRVEDAVRSLEDLNERYPDRPAVLEALGFAYVQSGRNAAAASAFVKAAENDLASSSLRPIAAEAYLKEGAPEKAAEQLRLYVAEFPGDFQVWQRLGEAEDSQGNVARAIDAYLEWYRLQPTGEAAYRLGTAFRRLNNAPQARTWYETAMRHADSHIDGALAGLLALEIEARDYAAAELTLGQLERNFPEYLTTLPDLPDYRADIARWKETRAAVDAARAEQDKLAAELAASRRTQEAALAGASTAVPATPTPPAVEPQATVPAASEPPPVASAPEPAPSPAVATPPESATPSTPTTGDADFDAALARKEAGDFTGAADLLQTALSYDDTRVELWLELADCYRRLRQFDAAEAYMLEARRRAPDSLQIEAAWINLGREHLTHDGYLARLDQARRRFPTNISLAYQLAHEFALAKVDRARTAAAYEDFLLIAAPDDPRRREAEEYLNRANKR
ncbi:MAG: tetratricopeptide repeat protein [Opitutaceae bacterium]|nr:tetratricopeptide repeat protein [Opitutaceae bacterium]